MPSYYESNYTGSEVDAAVKKIKDNVYVEKTTTINGKSLEQNVRLIASDIDGITSVVANPSDPATGGSLDKITVGGTIYSVGGGGDVTAAGDNTFTGNNTFTGENTFTKFENTVKFGNNIQNSAGNVLTLPNKAGTIALMSDIEKTLGDVAKLLADLDTGGGVQV